MTSARRLARLVRSLLPTLALAASACLAPTLPVPPPTAPEVSAPDSTGYVTVKGTAKPDAIVTVVNETAKANDPACRASAVDAGPCTAIVETPTHNDGSYWTLIKGASGDSIDVYQTIGTTSSDTSTAVSVP